MRITMSVPPTTRYLHLSHKFPSTFAKLLFLFFIIAGLIHETPFISNVSSQTTRQHPTVLVIFFDWQQDTLNSDGMPIAQQAAETWRSRKAAKVQVIGYTDRSLSPDESQLLSERMANNVATELVRLGVPQNKLNVSARGENDNRVPTQSGVREPQNQRVEIVIP
jgi:outer membrane protein OmpA-like peptidoglycan-associated protein